MSSLRNNNGVFCQDSSITLRAIPNANGTINTMAMAELLKGDGATRAVDVRQQHVRIKRDLHRPVEMPKTDPQRVRQLIAELESDQFPVQDKASEELKKLGKSAEPALRQALAGKPSAEVKQRIDGLFAWLAPQGVLNALNEDASVQDGKEGMNIAGDRCARQTIFTATRPPDNPQLDVDCEGAGGLSAVWMLNGRVLVLFCDAHLQTIPTTVALKIWKRMTN